MPPLALQVLLDALGRWAEISPAGPLAVQVEVQGEDLVFTVRTPTIQADYEVFEEHLHLLVERYRYLADQTVSCTTSPDGITVRLPLLEITDQKFT